jgi:hypothetical protein
LTRYLRVGAVGLSDPRRRRVVTLLLGNLLSVGCYSYVPVGNASTPAGAELRVELTPIGASRLAALVGPRAVRIDGRFVSVDSGGAMAVVPRSILSMDGMQSAWSGDAPLLLPPDAVASARRRQFSRRRTIVTATSAAVAAVAIGVTAARRHDKGGGPGNPPPPPPP